eukprot:GHVU01137684.1.p3 GENE.GHVU01137684.1~~GHVU01137684.1.p3  ORF type:complete len:102 (+),score=1.17 GHVU01137684.1:205-510(+)
MDCPFSVSFSTQGVLNNISDWGLIGDLLYRSSPSGRCCVSNIVRGCNLLSVTLLIPMSAPSLFSASKISVSSLLDKLLIVSSLLSGFGSATGISPVSSVIL